MSENGIIASPLLKQFQSSFKMLKQALENITDLRWNDGIDGWFFCMTAYHVVETMEFYIGSSPDTMKWGERAGYNWDDVKFVETDVLPLITKSLVTEYLDEMEQKITILLDSTTDSLLSGKDGFHWFESIYEKLIYLLRHNMSHIGELYRSLREWDCKHGKWV